jgi:hypothetical protein
MVRHLASRTCLLNGSYEHTILVMTYFLKVTEDYAHRQSFLSKLSDWLQDHVPVNSSIQDVDVHWSFGLLYESPQRPVDVLQQERFDNWNEQFDVYKTKYQKALERHFGFEMPANRVAEIHKIYCDEWQVFQIYFCFDCNIQGDDETNGMFFYIVEVDDAYMIQFQLTEM